MDQIFEVVKKIYVILREGSLSERRWEALILLGQLLVALGDFLDGSPPMVGSAESLPEGLETTEDCCEYLLANEPEPGTVAINPLLVLVIRRLVKLLFDQLL